MTSGSRSVPIMVGLLALATGLPAQPQAISVKAGDTEKWAFTMAGKQIGTMDATCTAVRTGSDKQTLLDWKYDLKLALPVQGQQVNITMNGTFTVTGRGNPVAVNLKANANGQSQELSGTFGGGKAKFSGQAGGQKMNREAAITGKEYLSINNVMTLMSIATRWLRIQPGRTVQAPFFAVEVMRNVDITFAAQPTTETITVGGKKVECVVCDVSPIQARVHLSKATGEMVRYTVAAQQLVIERK